MTSEEVGIWSILLVQVGTIVRTAVGRANGTSPSASIKPQDAGEFWVLQQEMLAGIRSIQEELKAMRTEELPAIRGEIRARRRM